MASFMSSRSWAQYGQACEDQEGPALKRGKSSVALSDVTCPTAATSAKSHKLLALPPPEPKVVKMSWKVLEKPWEMPKMPMKGCKGIATGWLSK